jgi:hypothetical protein
MPTTRNNCGNESGGQHDLDIAVSEDDKFLYSLNSGMGAPELIIVWRVVQGREETISAELISNEDGL